jgi:ubiquinone biosynthesis UbiH/UbiF/VisC/COQ6 family hydroxylase
MALGVHDGRLVLANGDVLAAPLVVAADSRFSELRRKAGIGADMKDFGRLCIVCRLRHALPHDGTAIEWFDADQTLAALPLNDSMSSIVATLPSDAGKAAMALAPAEYTADIERRFAAKWGHMELVGERHAYPLVAVWAHRFVADRFALVGDAAVGMHPVTAHGFNFGLAGADRLVRAMETALATGGDIGGPEVLARYDREHRRATYPLYLATNAIVGLYTTSGPLARVARHGLLRLGNVVAPVKDLLMQKLTEIDEARKVAAEHRDHH